MTDASQRGEVESLHDATERLFRAAYPGRSFVNLDPHAKWSWACAAWDERAALQAPPAPSGDSGAWEAAAFLLDRLTDFENDIASSHDAREFHGHVVPAAARLRQALAPRDAGGGSLRPSACVPSGDVDGGAGHPKTPRKPKARTPEELQDRMPR